MRISTVWNIAAKDIRRWRLVIALLFIVGLALTALDAYVSYTNDLLLAGQLGWMVSLVMQILVNCTLVCLYLILREDSPCADGALIRTRPVASGELFSAKLFMLFLLGVAPLAVSHPLSLAVWGFNGISLTALDVLLPLLAMNAVVFAFVHLLNDPRKDGVRAILFVIVLIGVSASVMIGAQREDYWSRHSALVVLEIFALCFGLLLAYDTYRYRDCIRLAKLALLSVVLAALLTASWPYAFLQPPSWPMLDTLADTISVEVDPASIRTTVINDKNGVVPGDHTVSVQWVEKYPGLPADIFITPYSRHQIVITIDGREPASTLRFPLYERRMSLRARGVLEAFKRAYPSTIVALPEMSDPSTSTLLLSPAGYEAVAGKEVLYSAAPVYAAYRWQRTFALDMRPGVAHIGEFEQYRLLRIESRADGRFAALRHVWISSPFDRQYSMMNRDVWWDRGESRQGLHTPAAIHALRHEPTGELVLLNDEWAAEYSGECTWNDVTPHVCDYTVPIPREVRRADGTLLEINDEWIAESMLTRFDPALQGWVKKSVRDLPVTIPGPTT